MKEKYLYWRYLGLTRETVVSFGERVAKDNLRVLRLESLIIGIVCFVMSFLSMFTVRKFSVQLLFLIIAFINILVFYLATQIKKLGARNPVRDSNLLIVLFEISVYFISAYVGVSRGNSLSALIVAAVIVCQVSFDVYPVQNLLLLCGALVGFALADYYNKDLSVYFQDIVNVYFCALIGNILSWKKSRIRYEHEEIMELVQRNNSILYRSSTTDPLTGLFNRRTAFDRLEVMAAQTCVARKELVVIIMDLDNFKKFNDTYGHPEGDKLLHNLGVLFMELQKKHRVTIARIGGEEFMCFYSEKEKVDTEALVAEIREGVAKLPHPESDKGICSTISMGIYKNISMEEDTAGRIYSKADSALYLAKRNGRNRAEYYDNNLEQ